MALKLETMCEKNLYFVKIQSKKLYFTQNSLSEKPLFLKEPARGPDQYNISNLIQTHFFTLLVLLQPAKARHTELQIRGVIEDNSKIIFSMCL